MRAFYGTRLEVPLQATINDPSNPCAAQVSITVVNVDGTPVETEHGAILFHPGVNLLAARVDARNYGLYTVTVGVSSLAGTSLGAYTTTAAALRPLTHLQRNQDSSFSPFGVNTHFDQKFGDSAVLSQLIEMAGIRWVRDSLDWNAVEPTGGGVYQIPSYDAQAISDLTDHNISILEMLGYFNANYGNYASQEAGFKNYASFVAGALDGKVSSFEIFNEPETFGPLPPDQYVLLLQDAYAGVKAANPSATVVGLGGASPGGWSGNYMSAAETKYMDTFSIHPYTTPYTADVGYPTVGAPAPLANLDYGSVLTFDFAGQIQAAQNLPAPPGIWITEMGWPTNYGDTNLIAQAQQVARAYILTAANPSLYKRMFIYQFWCEGTDPSNAEYNFGMVNNDYSIRPSYVATATTTRALEGRPFLEKVNYPNDAIRVYVFGPEDDPMIAAWVTEVSPSALAAAGISQPALLAQAEAGSSLNYQLPVTINLSQLGINCFSVAVHDWQDRVTRVPISQGNVTVNLTTSPIFLHLERDGFN